MYSTSFLELCDEQNFFAELEDRESEFGISDVQLGLTTLEEVFLNIARQAELETATAEGRLVTLTLNSGASVEVRNIRRSFSEKRKSGKLYYILSFMVLLVLV